MDLKPWELMSLCFIDFKLLLDGYKWRQERKEEEIAQFISAPIYNTAGKSLKKPITVEKILGRKLQKAGR